MTNFNDFIKRRLKEDASTLPPNQFDANFTGSQLPPTHNQNPGQDKPEIDQEIESFKNQLQSAIHSFQESLKKHHTKPEEYQDILGNIFKELLDQFNIQVSQHEFYPARTNNGAGITPPLQPMANG